MRIAVVTPSPLGSLSGNRVTAERAARRLHELGHDVTMATSWEGGDADVLIALHACKSLASIARWRRERPEAPLVVVLTGTDVYGGLAADPEATRALETATRIVALQPLAAKRLPEALRSRVDVVVQSAVAPRGGDPPRTDAFEACVLAHLREVKDPLRAAFAARRLPATSRLLVVHAGAPMDTALEALARRETHDNPRYEWRGPLPHDEAARLLARSRVVVVSSRAEGGANVVSEAVACGVPVVASAIDGSLGVLGDDWPATFPVGDESSLADLLHRCETDAAFFADLGERIAAMQPRFTPAAERQAWARVLERARGR